MDPAAAGFVSCFLTVYILPLLSCIVNTFFQLFSGKFSRVFQIISVIVYYTRFYQIVTFRGVNNIMSTEGIRGGEGSPGGKRREGAAGRFTPLCTRQIKKGKIPS